MTRLVLVGETADVFVCLGPDGSVDAARLSKPCPCGDPTCAPAHNGLGRWSLDGIQCMACYTTTCWHAVGPAGMECYNCLRDRGLMALPGLHRASRGASEAPTW